MPLSGCHPPGPSLRSTLEHPRLSGSSNLLLLVPPSRRMAPLPARGSVAQVSRLSPRAAAMKGVSTCTRIAALSVENRSSGELEGLPAMATQRPYANGDVEATPEAGSESFLSH